MITTIGVGISLIHQIAHGWWTNSHTRTYTYTINQIKSNPAVSIFHGQSGCAEEAPVYPAGTGDTYFQPTLCSANTSHLPLQAFKCYSLPLAWTRLRLISLQNSQWQAPRWDPQWHTGHRHSPGPFEVGWDGQGTAVSYHSTAASASTVSRGCRQVLEFLKASRLSSAAPAHPVCFGNELCWEFEHTPASQQSRILNPLSQQPLLTFFLSLCYYGDTLRNKPALWANKRCGQFK